MAYPDTHSTDTPRDAPCHAWYTHTLSHMVFSTDTHPVTHGTHTLSRVRIPYHARYSHILSCTVLSTHTLSRTVLTHPVMVLTHVRYSVHTHPITHDTHTSCHGTYTCAVFSILTYTLSCTVLTHPVLHTWYIHVMHGTQYSHTCHIWCSHTLSHARHTHIPCLMHGTHTPCLISRCFVCIRTTRP